MLTIRGYVWIFIVLFTISCYDFKSLFNLGTISKRCSSLILWWLFFKNKTIIIVIEVVWDFESLTVISVEYFCKVNPAWFTCLIVENIS